jgi:uncharacterized membrane protein HdeD (DUF308 family)
MLTAAARHWWVFVLQGVLGIIFGIIAIVQPNIALVSLAYVFAAWAIISGVAYIAEGFRVAEQRGTSWPFAVIGVLGIAAGVIAAVSPGITILTLVLLLGAWFVTQGVLEIYSAYRIRAEIDNEWILAAIGVLRVLAGIIILLMPQVGVVLTVALLAVWAIFGGVAAIFLGVRLRRLGNMGGQLGRPAGA